MKHRTLLTCSLVAFAATLAKAGPAEDAAAAAKKLADAANYSWSATTQNAGGGGGGGGGGGNAGPTTGKAEKGGYAVTTRQTQNGAMQTVVKGEQRVIQGQNGWMTMEEMRAQGGGGGGGGGGRGFGFGGGGQQPAVEIATLVAAVTEFKLVDGALVGALKTESVGPMLMGGGRGGPGGGGGQGGTPPVAKNASGVVKIWLKDGVVAKYEVNVKGTVPGRDGAERQVDRTTTTTISDIGTTKVEVPDAAKAKFT